MKKLIPFLIMLFVFLVISLTQIVLDMSRESAERSNGGTIVNTNERIRSNLLNFKIEQDGKVIDLASREESAIIIVFWASWCIGCISEIAMIDKEVKKLTKNKPYLLGINLDEMDLKDAIYLFEKKSGVKIAFDNIKDYGSISSSFDISSLPSTILYGRTSGVELYSEGRELLARDLERFFSSNM